jgi:hypothetical protein
VTTAEVKQCNLNNPPTKWLDIQTTVMQNFTVMFDESGYGALNVPISVHTDKVQFEVKHIFLLLNDMLFETCGFFLNPVASTDKNCKNLNL